MHLSFGGHIFVVHAVQLDMEDEDCIDMVREQIGGSARQHQAQ